MKYDLIIGNPPYQLGKNSNFYVDFLDKAAEHLREDGSFAFICPNRFMLPHHPASKVLRKYYQIDMLEVNVNKYFPTVGTKIGTILARRSGTGHKGPVKVKLADGEVISHKLDTPFPTKMPTMDGIKRFNKIKKMSHFVFVNKPKTDSFVFVCRQWKSIDGRITFDAVVNGSGDGRYIDTDRPQEVCDYLRNTNWSTELHQLFGDQMNIWPFVWRYIPDEV